PRCDRWHRHGESSRQRGMYRTVHEPGRPRIPGVRAPVHLPLAGCCKGGILPLMDIAVIPAAPEELPVLGRPRQFSAYDFSEYAGTDLDSNGIFGTTDPDNPHGLDPDEDDPVVFLIRVDGQLAGYAIVSRHDSYLGHVNPYLLSHFFIMRRYRRRGVG